MAKSLQEKSKSAEVTVEYTSPTPCHFNTSDQSFSLYQNNIYQLPDCDFVRSLIAQGRLVEKK